MSLSIRVNVTVPKEILNAANVRGEIEAALRNQTAPDLLKMFRGTVNGWVRRPDFSQKFSIGAHRLAVTVFPSGTHADTYALVNAGAKPHTIRRRRAPTLRFQTGYRPATSPRILSSRAASRFGNVVTPLEVRHPGFKGREFDAEIAEQYQPQFEKDIQDAINRGAR